ncbi:hypothetical protein ACOSQ3_014734 [Xanthoceras sorbifolium]
MNLEDIAKLCKELSIAEADGPSTILDDALREVGQRKIDLCLVRKVLMNKQINRGAFHRIIPKIWKATHAVEIEVTSKNTFAFYFQNQVDRGRIQAVGPYCFDKSLIVLTEPNEQGMIYNMNFDRVEFWVQIHNIPLLCMNKKVGIFLGK